MKSYCTQNSGVCSSCSLVNYGKDCRNNPVLDDTTAVKQIDQNTFEHAMAKAKAMQSCDPDRAEYWTGVQRGLRRAYHGERFGEPKEHALWLAAVNDDDPVRQQRGQGYRDGLAGAGRV